MKKFIAKLANKKEVKNLDLTARYIKREIELYKIEPEFKELIKRTIQVKLWDRAKTVAFFTGKITKAALGLKKGKRTKEHWYGATRLALELMEMEIIPSVDQIINDVKTKLTYNYTTKKENQNLKDNDQNYSLISPLVILADNEK